jgi:hypothetical protein
MTKLKIIILALFLSSCGGDPPVLSYGPPEVKIIHVTEGDRSMDCAALGGHLSCNWNAWEREGKCK